MSAPTKNGVPVKCAYGCGNDADKYSSGTPECWGCWYDRKMNIPAANHWLKAAEAFTSNVDMWDLQYFVPSALAAYVPDTHGDGLSPERQHQLENLTVEDFITALHVALALKQFSQRYKEGERHLVKKPEA